MLEALLPNYKGTLLLVSHDREFLENVVTSILAPDEDQPGVWREYMGGYQDWQRAVRARSEAAATEASAQKAKAEKKTAAQPATPKARKLTFTEAHELETLPDRIEAADEAKEAHLARLSTPDYYKRHQTEQAADRAKLEKLEAELETLMNRWEELESLER
jgi:ATP-binding cassette subfamily F protein uup